LKASEHGEPMMNLQAYADSLDASRASLVWTNVGRLKKLDSDVHGGCWQNRYICSGRKLAHAGWLPPSTFVPLRTPQYGPKSRRLSPPHLSCSPICKLCPIIISEIPSQISLEVCFTMA
jgi:hypothetical protein